MTQIKTSTHRDRTRQGIMRWAGQMIAFLVIFGSILFLSAGRLDWAPGWAYLGINALTQLLSALILIPRRPEMLAERSQVREGTKDWDRLLTPGVVLLGPGAMIIVAGLDARFGWTPFIGNGLWVAGILLAFGCQMFVLWAMASNPFFAGTVRIQSERGHAVVREGPYQLIRHPGYLGALLFSLACPFVLSSWWVILPAAFTDVLIIIRSWLEDRTLQAELPGYKEYASAVRYRLIPGIW